MRGWERLHLDELDAISLPHGLVWRPVRSRLGIRAFGINAYESDSPGRQVVEEHDELSGGAGGQEELYVVLRGRATFTVDGETTDAPAGSLVFIRDPALKRSAIAEEEGTLVLAIGAEAGRAFEVSAWESYYSALPDIRAGRWNDAIARLEQALRDRPGQPAILYHLACFESRAGREGEAIAHLREAIAGNPDYLETARGDADFDALRERPDFPG
jgi:tetratricopeptide (TPR) repeat protein